MKYAPIKIKDPLADGHLIRLHQTQAIHLLISSNFSKNLSVQSCGDILEVQNAYVDDDGNQHFIISHKNPVERYAAGWDGTSRLFLGEIIVTSQTVAASLCVIMEGQNPNNVIVINPKDYYLKMEPHNTIEVVTNTNSSSCLILGGDCGLALEWTGHNFNGIEQHFWFRLPNSGITKLSQLEKGTYDGGKLVFESLRLNISISYRTLKKLTRPVVGIHKTQSRKLPFPFYQQVSLQEIDSSIDAGCRVVWINPLD